MRRTGIAEAESNEIKMKPDIGIKTWDGVEMTPNKGDQRRDLGSAQRLVSMCGQWGLKQPSCLQMCTYLFPSPDSPQVRP